MLILVAISYHPVEWNKSLWKPADKLCSMVWEMERKGAVMAWWKWFYFKNYLVRFLKNLEDVLLNSSLKLRKGKFKSRKLLPAASLSYVEPVIAQDKINKKSDSFRWLVMWRPWCFILFSSVWAAFEAPLLCGWLLNSRNCPTWAN